ncbi:MAG TPA: hypothetical protein VEB69_13570 [Acidimicrobiia bacterium]|nr:hypothetical protein [Acidimicrobiia bacterium]
MAEEIRIEEYLVRGAALDLEQVDIRLAEAVSEAASRGLDWQRIGALLGSAAPGARQVSSALIELAS